MGQAGEGHGSLDRRQDLAVIRFVQPDGTESSGPPLPHAHAEALVRAFRALFPEPRLGVEVPFAFLGARQSSERSH
jgi:hypothetical protein